ncbi:MAG TPA: VOC family protein [Thermomicrobiales bacterium]|nr:VOC family protein [Thermomicrobiales bacterium]
MKTLFPALRIRDLDRAVAFYQALGYRELGRSDVGGGLILSWLSLDGDGDAVTLELSADPSVPSPEVGTGFSHLAIQVDDLTGFAQEVSTKGIAIGEIDYPAGPDGPKTVFLFDPDGYRLELVEWPEGHPADLVRADFEAGNRGESGNQQ